jgi:hypothetical protein
MDNLSKRLYYISPAILKARSKTKEIIKERESAPPPVSTAVQQWSRFVGVYEFDAQLARGPGV